ncbi:MAG: cyclic nucleotide-binding domain-containing protein [Candidatus Viridilinea halotolerans]|uniref:Cyclic nucleotide-binding domain-containing protein n=1 Tax=Candidatus Viridilinea halotolerans TaxID=2491704 RepID=A0A426TQT3_9CHLR|nr:MAG: cyclic nucleotide-binding domain-containing protein [Candidatus Viridilinea halotolerans]
MVSPELLRRYPFFSGLNTEQLTALAKAADEMTLEAGNTLFREGEDLHSLYLVIEGRVEITMTLPEVGNRLAVQQPDTPTREAVVSVINAGAVVAWSALIPPYVATSGARTASNCRLVALDCRDLRDSFDHDPHFGYLMLVKVAQAARDRIRDLHTEMLGG